MLHKHSFLSVLIFRRLFGLCTVIKVSIINCRWKNFTGNKWDVTI